MGSDKIWNCYAQIWYLPKFYSETQRHCHLSGVSLPRKPEPVLFTRIEAQISFVWDRDRGLKPPEIFRETPFSWVLFGHLVAF